MMNSSEGIIKVLFMESAKVLWGVIYFVEYNNEKSTTNFLFVQCFIFFGGGGLKRN